MEKDLCKRYTDYNPLVGSSDRDYSPINCFIMNKKETIFFAGTKNGHIYLLNPKKKYKIGKEYNLCLRVFYNLLLLTLSNS